MATITNKSARVIIDEQMKHYESTTLQDMQEKRHLEQTSNHYSANEGCIGYQVVNRETGEIMPDVISVDLIKNGMVIKRIEVDSDNTYKLLDEEGK